MARKKNEDPGEVTPELWKIYLDAWKDGIWLREFRSDKGYLVAAGSKKRLSQARREAKKQGRSLPPLAKCPPLLDIGDCIALDAEPGSGPTREKACRAAIAAYKKRNP